MGAYVTARARIYDMGRSAVVIECNDPRVTLKGKGLSSKKFNGFKNGDIVLVTFRISRLGKRMIVSVKDNDPLMAVTPRPVGTSPVAPPVAPPAVPVTPLTSIGDVVEPMPVHPAARSAVVKETPVTPKTLNGYYISDEARLNFTTLKEMSDRNPDRAAKLMMIGPSGYGKTTLPKLFAERIGYKFLRMNCATIRDSEEWFGFREAREGTTVFVKSTFIKTLEEGKVVVVLDEFNRVEPWLHNTLFPLLDDDGRTIVHEEEFVIGPNVIIVGTINTGYQYTGIFELDEALLNRFDLTVEVGPMPAVYEAEVLTARTGLDATKAEKVVRVANIIRQMKIMCSTRTTLLVARMATSGMELREAFDSAVVRRIPSDDTGMQIRKSLVDSINVELGELKRRVLLNDVFGADVAVATKEEIAVVEDEKVIGFFILRPATKTSLVSKIALVKQLRSLSMSGFTPKYSLEQFADMADKLIAGMLVTLNAVRVPSSMNAIEVAFGSFGITIGYEENKGA